MYFAVGYQQPDNGERFSDIVLSYENAVREVYFAWVGMPSGRPASGINDWSAQRRLEEDLFVFTKRGIKLDLLLNANCYGARAVSIAFEHEIVELLEYLAKLGCCPEIVTTTSLFVAHIVRKHCPDMEIRASVNMRIGTEQAMAYASECFDSFYIQRDYQRDIDYVRRIRQWCEAHGKKLCLLANSGCLRFCPGQTFHDNLMAHSTDASEMQNDPSWNPHLCRHVLNDVDSMTELLKATWIRPEDVCRYEGLVDVVKLATRHHSHPRMVIGSYVDGQYEGNLLDLLEPGFSQKFFPYYIENKCFPDNWAEQTSYCLNGCNGCGYCDEVLKQVRKKYF